MEGLGQELSKRLREEEEGKLNMNSSSIVLSLGIWPAAARESVQLSYPIIMCHNNRALQPQPGTNIKCK